MGYYLHIFTHFLSPGWMLHVLSKFAVNPRWRQNGKIAGRIYNNLGKEEDSEACEEDNLAYVQVLPTSGGILCD